MRKQRTYPTTCLLCAERIEEVTFRNNEFLRKFVSGQNKILPRRKTGTCAKHQRKVAREVKRGRQIGILRYRGQ